MITPWIKALNKGNGGRCPGQWHVAVRFCDFLLAAQLVFCQPMVC